MTVRRAIFASTPAFILGSTLWISSLARAENLTSIPSGGSKPASVIVSTKPKLRESPSSIPVETCPDPRQHKLTSADPFCIRVKSQPDSCTNPELKAWVEQHVGQTLDRGTEDFDEFSKQMDLTREIVISACSTNEHVHGIRLHQGSAAARESAYQLEARIPGEIEAGLMGAIAAGRIRVLTSQVFDLFYKLRQPHRPNSPTYFRFRFVLNNEGGLAAVSQLLYDGAPLRRFGG